MGRATDLHHPPSPACTKLESEFGSGTTRINLCLRKSSPTNPSRLAERLNRAGPKAIRFQAFEGFRHLPVVRVVSKRVAAVEASPAGESGSDGCHCSRTSFLG